MVFAATRRDLLNIIKLDSNFNTSFERIGWCAGYFWETTNTKACRSYSEPLEPRSGFTGEDLGEIVDSQVF
jgi:hypothetical protein